MKNKIYTVEREECLLLLSQKHILLCLCAISFVLTGSYMYSHINIFEFDTAYVLNIIQGLLLDGVPSINTINSTSIVSCFSDRVTIDCANTGLRGIPNVELVPIEHTSGYLVVYFSALFYKIISLPLHIIPDKSIEAGFSRLVMGYVMYISFIQVVCTIILYRLVYINKNRSLLIRRYGFLSLISFIFTPLLLKDILMDRIVGELPAVIFGLCAYHILFLLVLNFYSYLVLEKGDTPNEDKKRDIEYVWVCNAFIGLMVVVACEAKSAFIPFSVCILAFTFVISYFYMRKLSTFSQSKSLIHPSPLIALVFIIAAGGCIVSNKVIPIFIILLKRHKDMPDYLKATQEFVKFQANAGRNWGGDTSITGVNNMFQLLANHNINGVTLASISILVVSTYILILIVFSMTMFFNKTCRRWNMINLYMILLGNFVILMASYLYPLVYKFPYPRICALGVAICMQQALLLLALLHISTQESKHSMMVQG